MFKVVKSDFCVHLNYYPETRYEPAESYCEYGEKNGYDCDHCTYRYSKEDADAEWADLQYDIYRDQLYFET